MSKVHQQCVNVALLAALCAACGATPTPSLTHVGKSVATLEKFAGMVECTSTAPPALDPQAAWDSLPAANRLYPIAGWETFRNLTGGCANTRVDVFRAVASFNLASVAHLKGLVQKAELVIMPHALPPAAAPGAALTVAGSASAPGINLFCPAAIGGAGSLVRFGPNAQVPTTNGQGMFTMLGTDPFPTGSGTVYSLPNSFTTGAIANATSPSTVSRSGDGRGVIVTDVTGAITAALNADAPSISWMLTSNFEGSLPGQLPAAGTTNCKTAYDFDLRITHL